MDSAQTSNNANGEHTPYVEECQCPPGYSGLSCEVNIHFILLTKLNL
jgi:hypothetical protein